MIRQRWRTWLRPWAPFLSWPRPTGRTLRADARAGLTLGLILVPQAVAYAILAGMPPITGLYAALVPPLVGILWGSCGLLGIGPVALTSMLIAGSLTGLAWAGSPRWAELGVWLALMSGAIQFVIGALRLGTIVDFLSSTVVKAFTQAAALLIVLAQLPALFGMDVPQVWGALRDGHPITAWYGIDKIGAAFGLGTMAFLVVLRKHGKRYPLVIFAALCTGMLAWVTGYRTRGGAVVGELPAGLPDLAMPALLSWSDYRALLPAAIVIALVSFVETLASARSISRIQRVRWDGNQELIGQGLAKVASGFSGGFPVSASFSRSALNVYSGAMSGWTAGFSFLCVLATLLWFTPLLAWLPLPTLAAVIIVSSVLNLMEPAWFVQLWRASRGETFIALATVVATLIAAPQLQWGVLAGFVLSLGHYLYQRSHPRIIEVGAAEDGTLRDRMRLDLPPLAPDLLAVRMDEALNFVTASPLEHFILDRCRADPGIRQVLLHAGPINGIDNSGAETLAYLVGALRERGIALHLSGLKKQVEDVLTATRILPLPAPGQVFATEAQAIAALQGQERRTV
jgi:SulP family sulfate permease